MRCEACGAEAPALKTCRWRGGERSFVLCDPCWGPLAGSLWVVPGLVTVHGFCPSCSEWFSLNDLSGISPAGRRGAPVGACPGCSGGRACDNGGGG